MRTASKTSMPTGIATDGEGVHVVPRVHLRTTSRRRFPYDERLVLDIDDQDLVVGGVVRPSVGRWPYLYRC